MHTHTLAGAHLEVWAKRLTLNVGLLISRISGRSKTTIKRGVFGSEGSLASQHMDMVMKKWQKESHYGAPLRLHWATCRLIGHQESEREQPALAQARTSHTHTHIQRDVCAETCKQRTTNTYGYGWRYKRTFPYTHSQMYTSLCLPAQRKTKAFPWLLSSNFSLIKRGINFDLLQCSRSLVAQPAEKPKPTSIRQPPPHSQAQIVFHSFHSIWSQYR